MDERLLDPNRQPGRRLSNQKLRATRPRYNVIIPKRSRFVQAKCDQNIQVSGRADGEVAAFAEKQILNKRAHRGTIEPYQPKSRAWNLEHRPRQYKSQITNLTNLLDKGAVDNAALKLRIARLTDVYHSFEDQNLELEVLDPNDNHQEEFLSLQTRFFDLAGRIESILNVRNASDPSTSSNASQSDAADSVTAVKKRRIKLPEAPLPTFDGKFESWLSFKNAFRSMIGDQNDLTDIDKLHYLRSALKGEAANKIKILEIDGISYAKAWELLERSYEVKRILVHRHISCIVNLPALDKESTAGLTKLADDTQQHLASLAALGASVGTDMIVYHLESKLPKGVLKEWEATLKREELPNLDQLYEFIYKSAVCASRSEKAKTRDSDKAIGEPSAKRKRVHTSNQIFVASASRNCAACKTKRHPLYICETFKQLSVPKRIETVKQAKLCYNCLRSHRDSPCLPVTAHSLSIGALDGLNTESKGLVHVTIRSTQNNFSKKLTCLTIPTIVDLIPSEVFPRNSIKIPPNIKLADPDFHLPRPIDLLIASGATLSLFSVGRINLSPEGDDLYLQKTRLGWVTAGGASLQPPSKSACYLTTLETQLTKFWTIEEVAEDKLKSDEEIECEAHFVKTVSRDNTGRYTVSLPFRRTNQRIGESRTMALNRLASLERKFNANSAFREEYTRVIEEHVKSGHISLTKEFSDDGYYMPHHAVIKNTSNTTKLRVVFDASAKSRNGVSLNDVLLVGPTIQDKLFSHLIRFRTYKYVITADIEKMYLQVLLQDNDRRYQRFLWRTNDNVETYQINKLAFGVSSSPFLAIRVLQKLADDEAHAFPIAARVIKSHLYVDDLLSGADSIEEARAIRDEIIALLARGGFSIRQWAANDERIVNDLATSVLHAKFTFNEDRSFKTLGITWSTDGDELRYSINPIKITERITKRNILSEIAKIYDPLGLLGPVILYAKKMMQDVWRCGLHWDESVPQNVHTDWTEFARQLEELNEVSFDRKLFGDDYDEVQIHGFCDASNVGYGACVYARTRGKNKNVTARLLCAKSRVAPLKTITIPRLELCGALLLARLYREVSKALNIVPVKTICWCDSTIALHWIRTQPHLLKTYVANRVAEIQELVGSHMWRHVRSEDNPADAISRGQLPRAFTQNKTWSSGPSWLVEEEEKWPRQDPQKIEIPELKKNVCLIAEIRDFDLINKYSSYYKLRKIVAYCRRFRTRKEHSGPLHAKELDEAEIRVLKLLQGSRFTDEIAKLKNNKLSRTNKIANLNPFLDENGVIRVGGRLQASNRPFAQKHQILLPSRHSLTDSIIRETHEKYHHPGIVTTLHLVRQKFWLLDGRNQVRKIIRSCVRCFRFNAQVVEHKMGNLPITRVQEAIPFTNTGIDFCGPFYIKERKFRNRTRIKVYICIFVCMSVKAVHLELVSDLSSEGFIAALRRFVARRGMPAHIHSDNGSNFVGANNQLKELYALFNSEQHQTVLSQFISDHKITWHFIPPAAPHFGGIWESMIKLFKHHFKRVVGDSLFTFEQLNTFITEVEGILNSRPITSLSSDPNDLLVLTPAHYLIGKPLTTLPEGDVSCVPANRLSVWQHISKVRQDFWARWNLEYLNELQIRNKWTKDGPKLETGTIVCIKDKNLPCNQWTLGRIVETHPGTDGIVRAATIKTATGVIKRAAKALCPLPIER
ncbi:uncharacterized protein LOC113004665 [Solenopsis invicta]|uniref:uncharacterized protein LOC113004665 n=1 Tax=Solenopsis invicta TaxID=13686 RepID=UPI00193E5233|nr:uncharacterized protein LOC113004665 [Solenopsis invicta]